MAPLDGADPDRGDASGGVEEHEHILERLAAGDGPGARDAMQHHINQVARRFARG